MKNIRLLKTFSKFISHWEMLQNNSYSSELGFIKYITDHAALYDVGALFQIEGFV